MVVYESKYIRLVLEKDKDYYEATWLPETENMTEADYKKEFANFVNFYISSKAAKTLADNRELRFVVAPDLQEWVQNEMFAKMARANIKGKSAIILSAELIQQMVSEQLLDKEQEEKSTSVFGYFRNKEEALRWLES